MLFKITHPAGKGTTIRLNVQPLSANAIKDV
jgi:hypothetical protein